VPAIARRNLACIGLKVMLGDVSPTRCTTTILLATNISQTSPASPNTHYQVWTWNT